MPTETPSTTSFIAITGASGLIGRALLARLRLKGKRVRPLVRSPRPDSPDDIVWDPFVGSGLELAYKHAVKTVHPDTGGSNAAFRALSDARDALMKAL